MSIRFVLAALSVAVAVSSCGPVKYSSSENLDLKSVPEYAFIEPVADILYYDRKNKPVYDPEFSAEAADLITSIVSSQRYPFSEVMRMDYDHSDRKVRKWIQNIGSVSTSRLSKVRVPGDLLDAIDRSGHRYGVVIFSTGFIRSREAIRYEERQEAIGNVIGAALDAIFNKKNKDEDKKKSTYEPYSDPSNKTPYDCNMYCVVIDSVSDEIVHYIHPIPFLEKDPLNGRDMDTMLSRLLKDF
ncbi:MAG: hypothetical protein IKI00_09925 [Bacteroidales bacterium]|nr:hypothetical protein [Bacteroidales bacterium]